jgi:U3 small nucleolar RNA-associated protein MPP10
MEQLNPTDFLLPTPALTKETLRQTSLLYSQAFTALPQDIAMEKLEIGGEWDTEQVWQQMMLFNGPAVGSMRRALMGFEEEMKGRETAVESEEDLEESEVSEQEEGSELEEVSEQEEEIDEEEEASASGENDEEIPDNQDSDGDSELKAMMSDNEDADGSSAAASSKKSRKSIVDDEFFSLHDMQEFSEKAEAWDEIQQGRNEEDEESDNGGNEFDLGLGIFSVV